MSQEYELLVEAIRNTIERGEGFVVEQLPPLAQEMVRYGIIINTIAVLAFGLAAYYCLRFSRRTLRGLPKSPDQGMDSFLLVISAGVACICALSALFTLDTLVQTLIAPRYYILKRLAELLN